MSSNCRLSCARSDLCHVLVLADGRPTSIHAQKIVRRSRLWNRMERCYRSGTRLLPCSTWNLSAPYPKTTSSWMTSYPETLISSPKTWYETSKDSSLTH